MKFEAEQYEFPFCKERSLKPRIDIYIGFFRTCDKYIKQKQLKNTRIVSNEAGIQGISPNGGNAYFLYDYWKLPEYDQIRHQVMSLYAQGEIKQIAYI